MKDEHVIRLPDEEMDDLLWLLGYAATKAIEEDDPIALARTVRVSRALTDWR